MLTLKWVYQLTGYLYHGWCLFGVPFFCVTLPSGLTLWWLICGPWRKEATFKWMAHLESVMSTISWNMPTASQAPVCICHPPFRPHCDSLEIIPLHTPVSNLLKIWKSSLFPSFKTFSDQLQNFYNLILLTHSLSPHYIHRKVLSYSVFITLVIDHFFSSKQNLLFPEHNFQLRPWLPMLPSLQVESCFHLVHLPHLQQYFRIT